MSDGLLAATATAASTAAATAAAGRLSGTVWGGGLRGRRFRGRIRLRGLFFGVRTRGAYRTGFGLTGRRNFGLDGA